MATLEDKVLGRKDLKYRIKFINTCIMRIRFGHRKERTVRGYKLYIFKMMKDVIKKNMCNFENLLRATDCPEPPERDETLADCYIFFDKCIEKFRIKKGANFYYYFNKALSRNFYKEYQRYQRNSGIELTDAMEVVHPALRQNENFDTTNVLFESLGFTELDIRIANSRLKGQRTSEFLKENKDVTNDQYFRSLKHMKETLRNAQENGQY